MEYLFAIGLTLFASFAIIIFIEKRNISRIKKNRYRQSNRQNIMSGVILSKKYNTEKQKSQMQLRKEKTAVQVIIIDGSAYWVSDNMFYTADVIDGDVDLTNAKKVDTEKMSKKDIDKMLFILDNLEKENGKNERGSTGNK